MTGLERLKAFAKSPLHLWTAALTLGLGLASAHPVGIAAGAAAYALGWIYLPDTRWFKRWLAKRAATSPEALAERDRAAAVRSTRQRLFESLTDSRKDRYQELAVIAAEIESHLRSAPGPAQGADPLFSADLQMQPVDSLMATYLRLLHTGQVLERFLESEDDEALSADAGRLREEVARLAADSGTNQDLLSSRREKLATLEKRLARRREATSKLDLTRAEQERVVELVKLARAEVVTTSEPAALRHRIDAGARQMHETSAWTTAWDDGLDSDPAFDLSPGSRVGFDLGSPTQSQSPPPIPQSVTGRS